MQKREFMIQRAGTRFWYVKSDEEIERLKARDQEAGRFLDAAGEPLIYSSIGAETFKDDTLVTITRRGDRGPVGRVSPVAATIDGVPRLVMVKTH
jgi:predicted NBD/HSP70 family sugar kinase